MNKKEDLRIEKKDHLIDQEDLRSMAQKEDRMVERNQPEGLEGDEFGLRKIEKTSQEAA